MKYYLKQMIQSSVWACFSRVTPVVVFLLLGCSAIYVAGVAFAHGGDEEGAGAESRGAESGGTESGRAEGGGVERGGPKGVEVATAGKKNLKARKIHESKLPNGLTLLSIPDHSIPLVTIEAAVKNGSFTEPPELNGLSHLYEHMFFKGNKKIPDQENYLKKVRSLGMVSNAMTGEESVSYFFSMHRDNLEKGLEFMRDALLYPLFDKEELEKEKAVIEAEYDRAESGPHFHLQRAVAEGLWYKHWSRKNPIGTRDVIRKATRKQMLLIKQRYYQPSNTSLIIAGDVDSKTAKKLASRYFGGWKGKPVKLPDVKHPPMNDHVVSFVHKPVRSATLMIGFQGPSLRDDAKSTYAADVFCFGINSKASSFQKAMIRSGLAFRTSLFYLTRRSKGPIYLVLTLSPENVIPALTEIKKQMETWDKPEALTDSQIRGAKVRLEVDDVYSREKTSSFANLVGRWWASAGLPYYLSYTNNLVKVTREDMNRFVNRYIKGKPMSVGILMSKGAKEKAELTTKKIKDLLPSIEKSGGAR